MLNRNKKTVKKNISNKRSFSVPDEKRWKVKKILFFVLLIFFVGGSVWLLFFSSFVKIKHIKVDGFQEELVEKVVQNVSKSFYFSLIPQDNILLISHSQIEKQIKENLFLAQNIKIKKVFPDTVEVFLEKRNDVVAWCQGDPNQNCFLIDESGEVFYKLKNGERDFGNEFPVVFCKGTVGIEIGEKIIKPELAKFCSEISRFSQEEAGVNLENVYYSPSFIAGEIKVRTDQNWEVYFNSFSTAQKQARLLKSVLEKNIGEENVGKLEYIDLRLDGKVLYKLRESEIKADENEPNEESEEKETKN